MTMEYRGREDSEYTTKEKVAELLKTSKEDYRSYRTTHRGSFLRDACQKLYESMLNLGEYVYHARYTKLSHFTEDFYSDKAKLPISQQERSDLVTSVWFLHEFAYHGMEQDFTVKDYETKYNETYSKLHFLLEHSKRENKVLVKL